MFETHRSAAFPVQCDPNITLWNWVELAVVAPFFLLEIASPSKDSELIFHRMTANINVLRSHAHSFEEGHLKRVFLLSPSYINGSDAFQLDALESVFSSPNNSMNILFKLADGRTFYFGLEENRLDEPQYTVEIFKRSPETVSPQDFVRPVT